jgi:ribulose 1,5-bisphosphate carboxylase large subunit-like protein
MKSLDGATLNLLCHDKDARETLLRKIASERLAETPPPVLDDYLVASYFFAFRTLKLVDALKEIAYHATSGVKNPPRGSLLEQCTAKAAGVDAFDASGRVGLLHVAFPLKMMLQPDGHLTSCDLLHTVAAAIIFDVYENQDARLVALQIPERVIKTFPGPAYGPQGVRNVTRLPAGRPAFGTILKPTAGITPEEVGNMVKEVAAYPPLIFVKEDEDLYPNLSYSPVADRTRFAVSAIESVREERSGLGMIFAPHVTAAPHEILEIVQKVLESGATGVMFSETFAGGTVRMVREATKHLPHPPAIYGHNAGIGVKTSGIWREVIDLLARLDGVDFRQTAPVRSGQPFIRPYGPECRASEEVLARPLTAIKPTMIVRAGGLDQGNLCMNLADAEQRGVGDQILYLAGSAINSVKNEAGRPDPHLGAEAMWQALEIHRSGALCDVPFEKHVTTLAALAQAKHFKALRQALCQRYPEQVPL